MGLTPSPYKPGVITDDTEYSSAGYAISSDKIRWVRGKAQTLGGYEDALAGNLLSGKGRGAFSWVSVSGYVFTAIGTHRKLYVVNNGTAYDITPIRSSGTLTNPFTTTAGSDVVVVSHTAHGAITGDTVYLGCAATVGSVWVGGPVWYGEDILTACGGSSLVTVEVPGHGQVSGAFVTLTVASPVGGLTIAGTYTISVVDANTFTIDAGSTATSTGSGGGAVTAAFMIARTVTYIDANTYSVTVPVAASSSATGGGTVSYSYEINVGNEFGTAPGGYGTGGFGDGPYGLSADPVHRSDFLPRIWSLDSFGETLVANPLGGTIYQWPPNLSARATMVPNAPMVVDSILATPERYLMALGCTEPGSTSMATYKPMQICWCDLEDFTDWTPTLTNSAGDDQLQIGSLIVAGIRILGGSLIFTDQGVYAAQPTGSIDSIYSFVPVGTGCGLLSPKAVVAHDGSAWWLTAAAGAYTFSGGAASPLACPVRMWAYAHISANQQYLVHAHYEQDFHGITWHLPGGPDGEISNYIRYDTLETEDPNSGWSIGTSDMTAWIDRAPTDNPISVRKDGMVCNQEVGLSANGAAITRSLTYAPIDIGNGDSVLNVRRAVVDAENQGIISMTVSGRRWPNAPSYSKPPFSMTATTKYVDARMQARQVGFKYESSGTADYWRLGTIRYDISPGAAR